MQKLKRKKPSGTLGSSHYYYSILLISNDPKRARMHAVSPPLQGCVFMGKKIPQPARTAKLLRATFLHPSPN
jgi:hypothetical protein